MNQETEIIIQLVNGGYVLHTPVADGTMKTEVFVSTAKLNKAVRTTIDEFTLVSKKTSEAAESAE